MCAEYRELVRAYNDALDEVDAAELAVRRATRRGSSPAEAENQLKRAKREFASFVRSEKYRQCVASLRRILGQLPELEARFPEVAMFRGLCSQVRSKPCSSVPFFVCLH